VAPPSAEILPPLFAVVDVISITASVEMEIFTVGFIFSDVLEQPQKIRIQKKYFFMDLEHKN
jgi:membrane protein CcdC involved in cytochrome C biogenesis